MISDVLEFADEPTNDGAAFDNGQKAPWKVLIVDDEKEVHTVTELVLQDFRVLGSSIEFLHAYSAREALEIFQSESNIALALVDIIMEANDSGLVLVRTIREELNNQLVRIVLRTGQPGNAPEEHVISHYDVNDYKDKTELTSSKLRTLVYSTLRSYRDLVKLETHRVGLEKIIHSTADIFATKSMQSFVSAVLLQLSNLFGSAEKNTAYLKATSGIAASPTETGYQLMAGTGKYADIESNQALPATVKTDLDKALQAEDNLYYNDRLVTYFKSGVGNVNLLYIDGIAEISDIDKVLIEVFCSNVAIAFDNACLRREIEDTQNEVVYLLGDAIETRSKETGSHVKRMAEICEFLALESGLNPAQAGLIKAAAPLHDLGKIGISDTILNKPGKHTEEEKDLMRTHVTIGYDMLKKSNRPVFEYAAIIAHQHHEQWSGEGYPRGLTGDEIHIAGRIAAIADVFDALMSERCYKEAWPIDEVMDYLRSQRGKQFDPDLVDIMLANRERLIAINSSYDD